MNGHDCIPFEVYSRLRRYDFLRFFRNGSNPSASITRTTAPTVYSDSIRAAGLFIFTSDLQELLLLERTYEGSFGGYWTNPGGSRAMKLYGGLEDSLVTAVAETREEIGGLPRGTISTTSYVYPIPWGEGNYEAFLLMLDEGEKERFVVRRNWEHTDDKWVRRDSLGNLPVHPGVVRLIENYPFP